MRRNKLSKSDKGIMALLTRLYPLHRTINSDDMEKSIRLIGKYIGKGYKVRSYVPGKPAFNWKVPLRYSVDEAYIECRGKRIIDFGRSNLSVFSYSEAIEKTISYDELRRHVYTRPDRPRDIPWMFKYYERTWGFCMPHRDWLRLDRKASYKVVIKSRFEKKPFIIGECVIPGRSREEILWVSDVCHPSQVNDSLTGAVIAARLAKEWAKKYRGRFTLRFLFLPETIGSIVWLSNNRRKIKRIRFGMFCEMLGNRNRHLLKLSRDGNTPIDRIAQRVLEMYSSMGKTETIPFQQMVPANDEKIMDGVGIHIPTISFTRWPYPEYHTSADNPSIVSLACLRESFVAARQIINCLNGDLYPKSTVRGPIMLSRYNLWVPYETNPALNLSIQRILFMIDGQHSVTDISKELNLDRRMLLRYLERFAKHGLIRWKHGPWEKRSD